MRCKKCKAKISKGTEFCRKCGEPVKKRKKWPFLILAVAGFCVAACTVVFFAIGAWDYDIESERYYDYEFNETVLSEQDAATSENVPTAQQVYDQLVSRGFNEPTISANYDLAGQPLGEADNAVSADEKYPLYNVYYLTPSGNLWIIYVCNGSYMANPFFMYDQSGSQYLITEDDYVTGYSSNENKFIQTIPDESELIVKRVSKIDSKTLDSLDKSGIEAL